MSASLSVRTTPFCVPETCAVTLLDDFSGRIVVVRENANRINAFLVERLRQAGKLRTGPGLVVEACDGEAEGWGLPDGVRDRCRIAVSLARVDLNLFAEGRICRA